LGFLYLLFRHLYAKSSPLFLYGSPWIRKLACACSLSFPEAPLLLVSTLSWPQTLRASGVENGERREHQYSRLLRQSRTENLIGCDTKRIFCACSKN